MLTTVDKSKRLFNNRPIVAILLGLVLLGLCFSALPAYRYLKSVRSNSVLEASKKYHENQEFNLAFKKAHTAVLLNGKNEEASRHLAKLALDYGHPLAYKFWESVINSESATEEDWQHATRASLFNKSPEATFYYLERWKRHQETPSPTYLLTRARALILNDQHHLAKHELSANISTYPENIELHSLYFSLVNEFGTPQEKARNREILNTWKTRDDEIGVKTLRSIIVAKAYSPDDRKESANLLMNHSLRTKADELRALAALALIDPNYLNDLDQTTSELIDLEDNESIRIYTALLIETGNYEQVLQILNEDTAKSDKRLYQNFLIAKIGVGASDEVLDQTSEQTQQLSSLAEEAILRALAFKESGNDASYKFNIETSVNKATDEDLAFIQHHLLRLGEKDLLLQLYLKIGEHPKYGDNARQLAIQLAMDLQSEEDLLKILKSVDLGDDFISARQKPLWVYLHLLFGQDTEAARYQAQKLAANNGQSPFIKSLLAFSHYISGDTRTAQSLVPPTTSTQDLRSTLLQIAILKGTPREVGLREKLQHFDTSQLLPVERSLITL
ncbi:hypothetical protein MLD52_18265 [Puniceicoccaceae bacterium K14]|nr:hypothetical protein [Puniceicoccaceae bacterium K14]